MSPTPADYRAERKRRQLTQSELGLILGVARETVARRELGTFPITREAWLALWLLPTDWATLERMIAEGLREV